MNKYLSQKIAFFHLFGILLVLPIHTTIHGGSDFETARKAFVLFCRCFQPLFFGISGYLFFMGITRDNYIAELCRKIKKRFRSLIIPYLLWNTIVIFVFLFLAKYDIYTYLVKNAIQGLSESSLLKILHFIYVSPIDGHLWFLGDLIFVSLLTPVIYWLTKHFGILYIVAIASLSVLTGWTKFVSLFSFSVGAYLCISGANVLKKSKVLAVFFLIESIIYIVYFTNANVETPLITLCCWGPAYLLWSAYDYVPSIKRVTGGVISTHFLFISSTIRC